MKQGRYHMMIYIAMLAAQGVVIGLLERLIPSPFSFAPGAKLGLANLVTIIALFTLNLRSSIQVSLIRVLLTTLLGGTLSTFFYSFAGSVMSFITMLLLKQLGPMRVSIIGISIMGGMAHNIGQLLMAAFFAQSMAVLNYLPILSLSGIFAGLAVGIVGNLLLHKVAVLRLYHQSHVQTKNQVTWLQE